MKIYPSLLSCDFGRLSEEVAAVERAGADALHVDVMDGVFVPNLTIGPMVVEALKKIAKTPLDCHLMVSQPDSLIDAFAKAGAHTITVHLEACTHLQRTLSHIRSLGCKAGVSINPATPFEGLRWVLDDVDMILSMTVNPGFGGQKVIPAALTKTGELVKWVRQHSQRKIDVQMDGGVNVETSKQAKALGVDVLVAGSAVFGAPDYAKAIASLRA